MLAAALATVLGGCATRTGWERTTSRVCEPKGPPVLCIAAHPDAPVEIAAGGETILPGECARGPTDARGGSLGTHVVDGRGPERDVRVRVRRGVRTVVTTRGDADLDVRTRERCDASP